MSEIKKRLIMIMGVQRSGTTALFETLATAPGLTAHLENVGDAVYPEPENAPADNSFFAAILQRFGAKGRRTAKAIGNRQDSSAAPALLQPGDEGFLYQPDLFSPVLSRDPYNCFRRWRERGPVCFLPWQNSWLLLGYEEVATAILDREHFIAPPDMPSDPPENAEWEPHLQAYLTPENYALQSEKMKTEIRRALAAYADGTPFDWVGLCRNLKPQLYGDPLGIHPESFERFCDLALQQADRETLRPTLDTGGLLARLMDAGSLSWRGLWELILTLSLFRHFVSPTLGSVLYQLLQQPQWRQEIRKCPAQLPALVAELLRLLPSMMAIQRRACGDIVMGDTTIPDGSCVYLVLGSANRDPGKFERPDELQLDREAPPSTTFCLGVNSGWRVGEYLLRLITESALWVLLTELPPLQATAPLESVAFSYRMLSVSGPGQLMVKFDA